MNKIAHRQSGFTIIELIVVISVIAILAAITVFGYGAWRESISRTQIKSNLSAIASAMEDSKNFSGGYPAVIPDTVTINDGVLVTPYSMGPKAYCIDATSATNASIKYYIATETKDQGAIEGDCVTRSTISAPEALTGAVITSTASGAITLSWNIATGAAQYLAQCAQDPAFITGLEQQSVAGFGTTTGTVSGLPANVRMYCRARALNAAGGGDWSATVAATTGANSCTTSGKYGTYPNCYDYDSLPIASSIEGYWATAPAGYLIEDGSAVSRTTYADLFASIGTAFGAGDGATTFNLPDARGRTSVNRSPSETEFDVVGERTGSKAEQLTVAQIPSHTHKLPWQDNGSDVPDYLGGGPAAYGIASTYGGRTGDYSPLEPVGGDQPHNNIQPSIVKKFAIKSYVSSGSESMLPAGTSVQGYWTTAPVGYMLEDGAEVSRSTFSDLFAVIGTAHGAGNGSTTYNLPDSRGRASVNLNSSDTEFDVIGEKTGAKTEVLTTAQLPSHTHKVPYLASGSNVSDYLGGSGAAYGIASTYGGRTGYYDPLEPVGGGQSHNNIQPSIVKTFAVKYSPAAGSLSASPKGSSIEGYWATAPSGYLLENGAAVSRSTYADLFTIIGTAYGSGDGSTTFNLPDSRGRIGVSLSSSDAEFDTMGEKYGEKSHTLTIAEMPSHTHKLPWQDNGSDVSDYLAGSGASYGLSSSYTSKSGTYDMLEPVGGGQAHNNIQPSIVKMFAIKY